MSKILVSGLINIETTMKVDEFPIPYYPMRFPTFEINSAVSGVGYNVTKALHTLGNEVVLQSFIGKDQEGVRVKGELEQSGITTSAIEEKLSQTPQSIILYEPGGRRQGHCDLKDIQEHSYSEDLMKKNLDDCDMVCACNINFSRPLLTMAKEKGIRIASDVHVIGQIDDEYNKEFMKQSDILFLSDENLPCSPTEFIIRLKNEYPCQVIVIGLGKKGVILFSRKENTLYQVDAVQLRTVINTVGAGDALFSAFIHYICKDYEPLEAIKIAQCFAAYKIGENGAAKGFLTEKELMNFYEKTIFHIEKL